MQFICRTEIIMAKKNGAVIGYGGMGGWHTMFMQNSDVVNLCGIYDIKEDRRQAAKDNGIFAYSSLEELLSDEKIDFVTIAVPNDFHTPLAVEAMKHGKHVICEKPVTLSSELLGEMIDASKKYGKIFTVHQNRRWDGEFLVMRDIYNSGELGDIFTIESRVHGCRGIPGDWRQTKEQGGGMILDWGVHLIDQIMNIVTDRKLLSVYCKCDHITNVEVDDGFKLQMYFEGDLCAHVEVGTSHFITMPRFYMSGSNGSALIPDWGQPARVVSCTNYYDKNVVPVKTAAGITKTMAPRNYDSIKETFFPQPAADVHDFYRNFVKAIDGKETQLVTHEQQINLMKIMEAAFKSDELGLPVEIN